MVRINSDLIVRCSSRHLLPQDVGNIFRRVTHLYLQDQNIRVIENLENCRNLLALYLYDNRIEEINNLQSLKQLECLYLQNNKISAMKNLADLTKLTVLNLAGNVIKWVQGLESLSQLRELYLEFQKLPPYSGVGNALDFEQESIVAISKSLKTLNISGNQIVNIDSLRPLTSLEKFHAEDNKIWDVQKTAEILRRWKMLKVLKFNGNPLCRVRKYKDDIVVNCLELEELDGKPVSQTHRDFLLNWKQSRDLRERKKKSYEIMKPFLNTKDKTDVPLIMPRSMSARDISTTRPKLLRSRAKSITRRRVEEKTLSPSIH